MNHPAVPLLLTNGDRNTLTRWAHSTTAPYRVVTRAKALLMAGDGVVGRPQFSWTRISYS